MQYVLWARELLVCAGEEDGEALALLRSTHELALLKAVREVRKQQIKDANAKRWPACRRQGSCAEQRKRYYEGVSL